MPANVRIVIPLIAVAARIVLASVVLTGLLTGCDVSSSLAEKPSSQPKATELNYPTEVIRFEGICDGSAVVQLPNKNLLIAYDEENSLYEFSTRGGAVLSEHRYGKTPDGASEVDVEGAVAVDRYIWWIGSHGNDGNGRSAPARRQLFRATVSTDGNGQTRLEASTRRIDLLPELLAYGRAAGLWNNSLLKRKPKKGGINIEGLSVMENGDLLLGLRSPLIDTGTVNNKDKSAGSSAIVAQVNVSTPQPRVVRFYQLPLDNRGIRDIHATSTGFVLIAGDVDSGGTFSLYRWEPGSRPLRVVDLPSHFNAEAIVRTDQHWLVFSDDGKVRRSDESAADGERRCDSIRRKNPYAGQHPSVFFRALVLDHRVIQ